mmetsp:Transcript_24179/g.56189  ORF Transcript_24179/g.56189 Transcript_24179/m.56189 type:complete len:183 (+) Transcript_24179:64-612(+)|eukprot:CAMPEP_0178438252 /NCGR_PEP_ID=MMETSP0689_2-20121128/35491_1 /TAXON_ID=160604 /ORGANISM="Amphidinium massartii, Strain CS-259" /LENGTH=182 /DNA_ID=CAMNT_0020060637 /DNA_START=36 /DNA_END=584 /DNA_ORIENTATION=+
MALAQYGLRGGGAPGGGTNEGVVLYTSMGEVEVELYWQHAPRTCKNFYELAKRGYYDNTVFHRIVSDFVIQGGDPTGTGRGGESIYGSSFEDEIHPALKHTGAGILSMANAGQHTNGSQFFITLAPLPSLDGKHSIFGRVKRGMKVVQKMSRVQTNAQDKPINEVKINRASTALASEAIVVR